VGPAVRAVAGVGRYAVCVIACAVAFFTVEKVSPQAPQPYDSAVAIRALLPFVALLDLPLFFGAAFAGIFAAGSFLAFAGFSALGSRLGFSVPSTLQKTHPLQDPPVTAFPADDGLRCSVPSSRWYRTPSAVSTTSQVRSCF
jgi:hypothetical protein